MTLKKLVQHMVEKEHMGELSKTPKIAIAMVGPRGIRVSWNSRFEGKVVRQYQEFEYKAMCLDDGEPR